METEGERTLVATRLSEGSKNIAHVSPLHTRGGYLLGVANNYQNDPS